MAGRASQAHTFHTIWVCCGACRMNPAESAVRSEPRTGLSYGASLLNRVLTGVPDNDPRLTHVVELAARSADVTTWPTWASPEVVAALHDTGVETPWTHQIRTADLAFQGKHVVISTGTASGKSLGYQLPVLTALQADPK